MYTFLLGLFLTVELLDHTIYILDFNTVITGKGKGEKEEIEREGKERMG